MTQAEIEAISKAVAVAVAQTLAGLPSAPANEPTEAVSEPIKDVVATEPRFFSPHKLHAKFDEKFRGVFMEVTQQDQDTEKTYKGVLCKTKTCQWLINSGAVDAPNFHTLDLSKITKLWIDGSTYQPKPKSEDVC